MSRGLAKLAHRANGMEHPRRGVGVWAQPAEALRPSREAAWMWMIKRQKHIRTEPAGQFVVRGFHDERAAVRLRTIDFGNQAVAEALALLKQGQQQRLTAVHRATLLGYTRTAAVPI